MILAGYDNRRGFCLGLKIKEVMDIKAQRLEILQQVENGEISLEEASRWLAALDRVKSQNGSRSDGDGGSLGEARGLPIAETPVIATETRMAALAPETKSEPIEPEVVGTGPAQGISEEPRPPFWRGWWLVLFFPGLLLLVAAVNWMVQGYWVAGLSWGFWLSLIPFTIGVLMMWLGWEVRNARWLHLHVSQRNKPGPHDITISLPLPFGLVSWGIRRFGHFAGPIRGRNMDEILNELDQAVATDGPIHIYVDDKNGDQVEIWIDGPRSK